MLWYIFKVANMSFNAFRENTIYTKISEFTVQAIPLNLFALFLSF